MPGLRGTCLTPQKQLQRIYLINSHQSRKKASKRLHAVCLPLIHVQQKSHKSSHPRHNEEWWTTERILRRAALSVPIWEIRPDGRYTIKHLQNLLVPPNLSKVLAQNRRNLDRMSAAFPHPRAKTWQLSQASWTLTVFSTHMEHVLRNLGRHRKPYPMEILVLYGEAEAQTHEALKLQVGIDAMLKGRPFGERLLGAFTPGNALGLPWTALVFSGMAVVMYYNGFLTPRRQNADSSSDNAGEKV